MEHIKQITQMSESELQEFFTNRVKSNFKRNRSEGEINVGRLFLRKSAYRGNWKEQIDAYKTVSLDDAISVADILAYFTGGFEVKLVKNEFVVTSKGYYHYIGA